MGIAPNGLFEVQLGHTDKQLRNVRVANCGSWLLYYTMALTLAAAVFLQTSQAQVPGVLVSYNSAVTQSEH